ncbi:FMN-binding negative transcriptional regulator [Serratia inhibens]|uniref:FMN-binding negative transcriptional regulator n=1 Tax=Serratia inhibens TaxID=2338073 RepID=A0AA93BUZ5_9GAMM|nr:FMN-binding negative transcriptional regulator [Serratia inhibens]ANS44774.1 Protease synthase and sporulation protein PAI 2 [Serratia inhibens PRI-2C]RJF54062.1 FMN-binding negative transcriptional regulator [Serratia inhibens]
MYTPKKMIMADSENIATFIAGNSFGLMVSPSLTATHLPFVFHPDEGTKGMLYGHVARANPHWKELEGQQVLVAFTGPHAYISPTWYQAQEAVPTWNYAAVHCYGTVEMLDAEETERAMQVLVNTFEPGLMEKRQLMPAEFVSKKRQAIVAFKIRLDDIQAKEKLGQHRSEDDQRGVLAALESSPRADNQQLADYMKTRRVGTGE